MTDTKMHQILTQELYKTARLAFFLLLLAFVAVGTLGFLLGKQVGMKSVIPPSSDVACTDDARVCADGSTVGRVAPACAFAPCPEELDGQDSIACTLEALECPDGSFVGRQGPDCAFAACPDGSIPLSGAEEAEPAL